MRLRWWVAYSLEFYFLLKLGLLLLIFIVLLLIIDEALADEALLPGFVGELLNTVGKDHKSEETMAVFVLLAEVASTPWDNDFFQDCLVIGHEFLLFRLVYDCDHAGEEFCLLSLDEYVFFYLSVNDFREILRQEVASFSSCHVSISLFRLIEVVHLLLDICIDSLHLISNLQSNIMQSS